MSTTTRPIIVIVGPTAGGKTALAIELAKRLPGGHPDRASGTDPSDLPGDLSGGECISADSMQVYRGMDIGTAKPTAEERGAVPHHLIDLIDPGEDESFTVDHWLELAERVIVEVRSRGRWPIVVGGTNLYVQALLYGLFDGPEPDRDLRRELDLLDDEALREELERVDPEAARRIHLRDRRRTTRALEVYRLTGTPISRLQQQWSQRSPRADALVIGLEYAVETINRRINARVMAMMEAGFLDEVNRLLEQDRFGVQSREALGYKQLIEYVEGRAGGLGLQEVVEQIKIQTRRFARQQRSWLRRFRTIPDSMWIPADDLTAAEVAVQAVPFVLGRCPQQ